MQYVPVVDLQQKEAPFLPRLKSGVSWRNDMLFGFAVAVDATALALALIALVCSRGGDSDCRR